MRLALAALLLAAAAPTRGAATAAVSRGDLTIRVRVTGTVVPEGVFRLKSTIAGRIETVQTSSYTWRGADQPLAFLAHKELAALIDARGAQSKDMLEDRWQRVYRPTPVRCPDECYVLRVYAKAKTWVRPDALLFEAARKLKMIARVKPEDVPLVRDGQTLTFWPVNDPKRRLTGRVTRFVLDVRGVDASPWGTFTLYMSPDRYFPPGTEWEGEIVPSVKHDVLMVPTAALIDYGGETYLPVRVSTGVTTDDFTQITAGAHDKREILVLDDARLKGAGRHRRVVDQAAIEAREKEIEAAAPPPPAPPPPAADETPAPQQTLAPAEPAPAAPAPADEVPTETVPDRGRDYNGEDPYGIQ